MLLQTQDTIVAIASPPGGALRGIVRVSGPRAIDIAQAWFRPANGSQLSEIRRALVVPGVALLNERDALPGELYVWPGERSYTRQPTVEFHTLSSPPLLALLVKHICTHGARVAEPGEFTLRAFLAGRLDLTQAEAVLGVIDAGSQSELSVALRQLGGGLSGPLSSVRDELLEALAHLEAGLDFVEEDIEFIAHDTLRRQLQRSQSAVATLMERMTARSSATSEYRIVLYGRPNVGKSSLLNALAKSQRAIVSDVAGTTRDYVTASLECGAFRCQLIDTAGRAGDVSPPVPGIDSAAQSASQQQSDEAHLRLLCLDSTRPLDAWESSELHRNDPRRLLICTKCDTGESSLPASIATSSVRGLGLAELDSAIAERLAELANAQGDVVAGTAARCRDSLERAAVSLTAALDALDSGLGEEFVAGEIRVTLEELGCVAGAVYTDDILDRIFSRFCIGK